MSIDIEKDLRCRKGAVSILVLCQLLHLNSTFESSFQKNPICFKCLGRLTMILTMKERVEKYQTKLVEMVSSILKLLVKSNSSLGLNKKSGANSINAERDQLIHGKW